MKLIVGLGNPEEKYKKTRHNIGYWVIEALLRKLAPVEKTLWRSKKRTLKAEIAFLHSGGANLILAKPLVSMNASGIAVKKLVQFSNLTREQLNNLFIIHDDLDLLLGQIKIAKGRGAAGHRGVKSVIKNLGTDDFVRFRLGIGSPKKKGKWWVSLGGLTSENVKHQEVIDFVLSEFEQKEKFEAGKMVKRAVEMIKYALENGVEASMNRYHQ